MKNLIFTSITIMIIMMTISLSVMAACNCLTIEKQSDEDTSSDSTTCGDPPITCTIYANCIAATYACTKELNNSNCKSSTVGQLILWDGGCNGEGGCKTLSIRYWEDPTAFSYPCSY